MHGICHLAQLPIRHPMKNHTKMKTSIQLRDEGIELVDKNTSYEWKESADNAICSLALSGRTFTAEDVRRLAGSPSRPNAFGSRFMKAIRRGWIKKVGYTNAARPDAHARALAQYRGSGI